MRQRLFVILNLSLVSSMVILGFNIISPVLPQYALSFSVTVALTGWAISAFALARLVTDMPAGFLADRFGNKRVMVLGLVLVTISSIVSGMANDYSWLIVGRVVQGLGSALYMTAATTWVAWLSRGSHRGRVMSLYSGLIFAATSAGPVIGGFSASNFGLQAPFFVYGGFAVLGLLATIPLREKSEGHEETQSKVQLGDIPGVLLNGPFLLVNCSVLALFFLRGAVRSTLVPLYASLNLGLSEESIGLLLTVAAVFTSLCTYPSGWLSDKVGRKIPIMACLFLSALASFLIPLQGSAGGLAAVMAFYGLATGLQGSIAAWPADIAPRDKLGTAMGVYRVIGDTGLFLGPIAVTYAAGYTSSLMITMEPFLIPAFLAIAVGILMIWARDPARERGREQVVSAPD